MIPTRTQADRSARPPGRRSVLGLLAASMAGIAGAFVGQPAAVGKGKGKGGQTVSKARCRCLQSAAGIEAATATYCAFNVVDDAKRPTCIDEGKACARLAGQCKAEAAETCVDDWGATWIAFG